MFGIRLNLTCDKIFLLVTSSTKCDTKILHEADMLDFIMKKFCNHAETSNSLVLLGHVKTKCTEISLLRHMSTNF